MPSFLNLKQIPKAAKGPPRKAAFAALSVVLALCSPFASAAEQDDWWFDVEVIVFKRNLELHNIAEKFPISEPAVLSGSLVDLLLPYIKPDFAFLSNSMVFCLQSQQKKAAAEQFKSLQSLTRAAYEKADSLASQARANTGYGLDPLSPSPTGDSGPHQDEKDTSLLDSLLSVYDASLGQNTSGFENTLIDWQLPSQLPCSHEQPEKLLVNPFEVPAPENYVNRIPVQINGQGSSRSRQAHLLPQSALLLSSLFKDINRQRDISPILHMGWRQPVLFGKNRAAKFRLFAGYNYANAYSSSGHALTPPSASIMQAAYAGDLSTFPPQNTALTRDDLFSKIHAALNDPSAPNLPKTPQNAAVSSTLATKLNQLWQLDGELKVYLQNVGRTPYLHIASDLEYRIPIALENTAGFINETTAGQAQGDPTLVVERDVGLIEAMPTEENFLQSVKFKQLRRVISKQLHYFDHPLFGMVVHIKRHKWPDPAVSAAEQLNTDGVNTPQTIEN